MCDSTKWFFFMLALHMCSGRPVLADCWRAKSSGRLLAVAHRQRGVQIQIGGLLHHPDQLADRNLGQHVAGALRVAHVAAEQAGVGLADLGQRLAGDEMDDVVLLEARVRLAPAQNRQ